MRTGGRAAAGGAVPAVLVLEGGRRSRARAPETVVALSLPVPAPSVPVIFLAPHWPLTRRSSKALETVPLAVLASTLASAGSGSRMATSPETVVRVMSAPFGGVEVEDHVAADGVGPHRAARALDDRQIAGDGVEAQIAGDRLGLDIAGDGVGPHPAGQPDERGVAGDAADVRTPRDAGDHRAGADHADLDPGAGRHGQRDHRAAVPALAVEELQEALPGQVLVGDRECAVGRTRRSAAGPPSR